MVQGTTGSYASLVARQNFIQNQIQDQVYREAQLIMFMDGAGKKQDSGGPSPFLVPMITAGTSPSAFFEDEQFALTGSQTYNQASTKAFYIGAKYGYSGMVADNNRHNGYVEDIAQLETVEKGAADVFKKVDDTLCGSTQDQGISAILDDTAVNGGINPGSVTTWASKVVTPASGSYVLRAIEDAQGALAASPYVSRPTHVLMPPGQVLNLSRQTSLTSLGPQVRINDPGSSTGRLDFSSYQPTRMGVGGIDVVSINGLTSTESFVVDINQLLLLEHRPVTIKSIPNATNPDSEAVLVSWGGAMVALKRNAHARIKSLASTV